MNQLIRVHGHEFSSFFRVAQHDFQSNLYFNGTYFSCLHQVFLSRAQYCFFSFVIHFANFKGYYSTFNQEIIILVLIALYSVGNST